MSKQDVSAILGQKLLEGWTMLEEACDDCNVPLMRNREGEVICFSCNAHFIKNQDGLYIKEVLQEQMPSVETVPTPHTGSYPSIESNLMDFVSVRTKRLLEESEADDTVLERKLQIIQSAISCLKEIHNLY